jgi:MFS family permease
VERLFTRPFTLAFAAHFMHALSLHNFLHLPGFLQQMTSDTFVIGLVIGTFSASAIAFRPALGRIMDSRGRKIVLTIGGLVNVGASASYLLVDHVGPMLFCVRILHGLAQGMLFSVLFTIAADLVPASRRTQGIGIFGVSGMIPFGIAGLTGDAILEAASYRELFLFACACAAVGCLIALALPDSRPAIDPGAPVRRSFLGSMLDRQLLPIWVAALSFGLSIASYNAFLKTFVLERGVGSVGSFFAMYTATAVALRLFGGRLPDLVGARRMLVPSLVALSAGIAVLAHAHTDAAVLVAGAMCGAGHGYAFPIASTLVVERARGNERGTALAGFTALFDIGLLVGAPSFGLLLRGTDYTVMFTAAAATVAIGAAIFSLWDGHSTNAHR